MSSAIDVMLKLALYFGNTRQLRIANHSTTPQIIACRAVTVFCGCFFIFYKNIFLNHFYYKKTK